jgi:FMN-dependent oxidoreductase (nitrilotriacetate monooxygenase family)
MDKLYEHDLRYDMADEYLDLVNKLWDSWEPDAVIRDRETGTYADPGKVRTIDFAGKFYKSRGPLNTVPSPQVRPAFVQAGGSPRGREFASRHADSIIATATGIEGMKAYRDDVRARAEKNGRDPDDIKVLFLVSPIVGATEEEARAKQARAGQSRYAIETTLAGISSVTDIDFSKFDLDKPLPEGLTTNGERGSLDKFAQWGSGKSLRQLVADRVNASGCIELVGTPDHIAQTMEAAMQQVGGDGFLITSAGQRLSRALIADVTDGLVPALQRRGLTRSSYARQHLRDTLREF